MNDVKRSDITGAILAGGKSSRMGTDKAMLTFEGQPFVGRIADTLRAVFARAIVVSDRTEAYEWLGLPVFTDVIKNSGPLGGIHAALCHAETDAVFVAACDLPLLRPEVVQWIVDRSEDADASLCTEMGRLHALCGLYRRSCLRELEERLVRQEYTVSQFLRSSRCRLNMLRPPEEFSATLRNVNTPAEYSSMLLSRSFPKL